MPECIFFLTRIFPWKDRLADVALVRKNIDQRKPVFWQILHSIFPVSYSAFANKSPLSYQLLQLLKYSGCEVIVVFLTLFLVGRFWEPLTSCWFSFKKTVERVGPLTWNFMTFPKIYFVRSLFKWNNKKICHCCWNGTCLAGAVGPFFEFFIMKFWLLW